MAAVTHRDLAATSTDSDTFSSASFTPTAGDTVCVFVCVTNTVSTGTCSGSANGLTFTLRENISNGGARLLYFQSDQKVGASPVAMTVTVDVTGDQGSGWQLYTETVAGLNKFGASAIRQHAVNNAASGVTPNVVLGGACLTGNPVLAFMANGTNPGTMTPPTGFTERGDTGTATPVKGSELATIDSGFTGSTVTWGSASATAWAAIVIELDTSGLDATVTAVAATATATGFPPVPSAGSTVSAVAATATAAGAAPAVSSSTTVTAVAATATALAVAPTVQVINPLDATVSAAVASANAVAASPAVQVFNPTFVFEPPTHEEGIKTQTLPLKYFRYTYANSVVRVNGVFTSVRTPSVDMVEAAGVNGVDWFRGGYVYDVDAATATELRNAGFPVTTVQPGGLPTPPPDDTDPDGYGEGGYGEGPYGL